MEYPSKEYLEKLLELAAKFGTELLVVGDIKIVNPKKQAPPNIPAPLIEKTEEDYEKDRLTQREREDKILFGGN